MDLACTTLSGRLSPHVDNSVSKKIIYTNHTLYDFSVVNARRTVHPPIHSRWPSVPCGCCTCLEFLATQCSFYVVAGFLLSASKDSPVRCVISSLILNAILELSFCTVPLQQFLWQRHLNQLSLAIPSWVGAMSTSQRAVMPCGWGVKARMVRVWVAGKTVWSSCYTRSISDRFRDKKLIIKRYAAAMLYVLRKCPDVVLTVIKWCCLIAVALA